MPYFLLIFFSNQYIYTTMADQTGWEAQLSVLEKNVYLDYFKKIDSDNKGIVLQDEAIPFLKMSAIPDNILMQFWAATDNDKKGFLTSQEFCCLLKLIACAQHGVMTAEPILSTKVPLPDFSGQGTPRMQTTDTPQDTISPEDRMKYIQLFQSFHPVNNILSGEQAKQAFMRSNLPPTTLQAIWNLADTRRSGSLNQTEFIIAMHYIERAMKGAVQLPASLPPNLYASATGRMTGASPLMRKNTLQVPSSPPPIPTRSPVFKGATTTVVEITPEEYQKYQTFFRQLDTDQSGYVTGADAVVFFKHSKLPESDLARIWDLADARSTGQLNQQEFAMAMHLINRRIAGGELPTHLPSFSNTMPQTEPVDLLGLSSNQDTAVPTQSTETNALERSQQLKATIEAETNRAQQASQQWQAESQAVQQLLQQIEEQKQLLSQKKQEADKAEEKLASERKKKEELTKELQMYKQEVKHYNTRLEEMQQETDRLQKENKAASPVTSPSIPSRPVPLNDVFSLSTTPQTLDTKSPGHLFAKVDHKESPSPSTMPQALDTKSPGHLFAKVDKESPSTTFDPFAGFKQQQQQNASPTVSLNQLKQEAEAKKREHSPQLDISEIESKFPDLNVMEQNFSTPKTSVSPTLVKQQAPTTSKSKDNFDLSAFESPSFHHDKSNVKDDLSSLFGSPSLAKAEQTTEQKHGFDDIFSTPITQEPKNTFEDIFMKK
ncbi:hypothetical protein BD560DRAFT_487807 [Blakeslea trispora]|nr:hypothetical protein BD560DRAFT_487807 [Blakeslea trispora]